MHGHEESTHQHRHHEADRQRHHHRAERSRGKRQVLVDAANVAFTNHDEPNARGSVENIRAMRKALIDLGLHPIFIADASLKYSVDHPEKLNELEQSGQILQAPAGTQADYFLLALARREDAPIISNDVFRDRRDEFPEAFRHRVPFMIVDGQVVIDRERLRQAERHLQPGTASS